MGDIDNSQDVINVEDITDRVEELESEQESLVEDYTDAEDGSEEQANAINALSDFWHITPEEVADAVAALDEPSDSFNGDEELHKLKELLSDMQGYGGDHQWRGDWYPGYIIRESYFTDYCEELVKDIGDLPQDIPSYLAIDWEKTADNLRVDYTESEYDGVTYLYR